jgi:para-nitrobenzyl esterase
MDRREFLRHTSVFAFSASMLVQNADGQDRKFVVAETNSGKVRGVDNLGIKVFKGIPYGANTAGNNRFMPPADPPKWSGVRDALEYGDSAPQPDGRSPSIAAGMWGPNLPAQGEDCLVLNVWTPALKDGHKRPVMFWCHGGGFATGTGSSPDTDGTNLARRGDVVVVSVNHRLNVLGFGNLSEFSRDFAASGDSGLLDIVHALLWVRLNIGNFGGDPNTVMIFGQSGGGRKVEALLSMPSGKGLFHRAVIESGKALRVASRDAANRNAEQLLAKLGIRKNEVHDLQKIPLERIMSAYTAVVGEAKNVDQSVSGFAPTVDGTIVPQHPFYPVASPVSADVPVMIGYTRTEQTLFSADDPTAFHLDDKGMRLRIKELLGDQAPPIIDLYRNLNPGATPSDIYFLSASDHRMGAETMKIGERRAELGKGAVYMYYFAWESPVQGGRFKSPHTIEIPFAFDNVQICSRLTGGGVEAMNLADKVSDAWIAFARTGNPNTPKLPRWPEFTTKDRATLIIDTTSRIANDPLRAQRIAMSRILNLT